MREIILDTETTGLDPLRGDRLVEIGCVEIFNRMPISTSRSPRNGSRPVVSVSRMISRMNQKTADLAEQARRIRFAAAAS